MRCDYLQFQLSVVGLGTCHPQVQGKYSVNGKKCNCPCTLPEHTFSEYFVFSLQHMEILLQFMW